MVSVSGHPNEFKTRQERNPRWAPGVARPEMDLRLATVRWRLAYFTAVL